MEDFTELLTCPITEIIPFLESICDIDDRYIKYQATFNSDAFNEDIFVTITVEDADAQIFKKYELKRLNNQISLREIVSDAD